MSNCACVLENWAPEDADEKETVPANLSWLQALQLSLRLVQIRKHAPCHPEAH